MILLRHFRDHLSHWWGLLLHPDEAGRHVLAAQQPRGFAPFLLVWVVVLYMLYGVSMGMFLGGFPALVSAIKLPVLFLMILLVSGPALYAANCALGPRLTLAQCMRLVLLLLSANAVAVAGYSPFSYFFVLTTSAEGHTFLVLMNVFVFVGAGAASFVVSALIFRDTARRLDAPLRPAFLLAAALIYAVTAAQMSWVLRPWVGSPSIEYQILRPLGGSFFEAVWSMMQGYL